MDFLSGGNLCDLVLDSGRLSEDTSKRYFLQMMQGLRYIHNQGVVHRDIKLENVFLNHDRSVAVIGDFGLSNFWCPGATLRTRCGSAEYAAPELLDRSQVYDQAVDVWSSGVVLFAMLVGDLPFNAAETKNKVTELFKQIKAGLTPVHFNLLAHVSVEAKVLMNKILVVDQSQRLKTGQILSDAWFSDLETPHLTDLPHLSLETQLQVAETVKSKLQLSQWTPNQILTYVMSAKGKFGKTAGVFNIIARDFQMSQLGRAQSSLRPIVKQPVVIKKTKKTPEQVKVTGPKETIQEMEEEARQEVKEWPMQETKEETKTPRPRAKSFWQHGEGKAAISALSQIKSEQLKDKQRPVIAKPPTPKPRVVKPFFKPEKLSRGQWRRSTAPGAGHQRTGRLKRVDTTETAGGARTRRPLADINNIYDN